MNRRRLAVGVAGTATALLAAVVFGGGTVYAGQLLPAPSRDRTFDIEATITDRGTVILPAERRACLERFGLLLEDGFVQFGGTVTGTCHGNEVVERDVLAILEGRPRPDATQSARFDEYIHLGGPEAVGLAHTDVVVETEMGQAPAWFVDGEDPTWVIVVHGRSGTRGEALRLLPSIVGAGHPALVITYRNDFAGGPAASDDQGLFGQAEWPDLAAAVDHALAEGSQKVILAGFSQGGSLISYYLRERGEDNVAAVILDAPLLSLPDTLIQQARNRGIPDLLIPPILFGTRIVAQVKGGFDVADVDHVQTLAAGQAPLLLIHGDADDFVPIGPSDRLAAARSASLTYERVAGAGHVEAANTNAARYHEVVTTFLASLQE